MRTFAIVLGVGVAAMSQCWAHGRPSTPGPAMQPDRSMLDTLPQRSPRDTPEPETHPSKNPYEELSCPQLYVLATQGTQNSDLANAFKDKDCHAL